MRNATKKQPVRPNLELGSLVVCTRATAVCDLGEVGVVYEVYERGEGDPDGDDGFSIIFSSGLHDGWSWSDVPIALRPLGEIDYSIQGYVFKNVGVLAADWRGGVFSKAFENARRVLTLQSGAPCGSSRVH